MFIRFITFFCLLLQGSLCLKAEPTSSIQISFFPLPFRTSLSGSPIATLLENQEHGVLVLFTDSVAGQMRHDIFSERSGSFIYSDAYVLSNFFRREGISYNANIENVYQKMGYTGVGTGQKITALNNRFSLKQHNPDVGEFDPRCELYSAYYLLLNEEQLKFEREGGEWSALDRIVTQIQQDFPDKGKEEIAREALKKFESQYGSFEQKLKSARQRVQMAGSALSAYGAPREDDQQRLFFVTVSDEAVSFDNEKCQETWKDDNPVKAFSYAYTPGSVIEYNGKLYIVSAEGLTILQADNAWFANLSVPVAISPKTWLVPDEWLFSEMAFQYPEQRNMLLDTSGLISPEFLFKTSKRIKDILEQTYPSQFQ